MEISFYGAASEVGRSCILISTDKTRVLVDAGIKLGRHEEHPQIEDNLAKKVDAIVLSHAHLDHTGYLPHIYSKGYAGPIYATKPTMEVATVLLSDYMHISNPQDVTKDGLKRLQSSYKVKEYHSDFTVGDMKFRFIPAGHILGSAMVSISDGKNTILYTGDANTQKTKLFDGADLRNLNADTLITESTYGLQSDVFPKERDTVKLMINSIKETLKEGGKVIVPSFAVGRAQEVLLLFDDYLNSGILPKVPIYIDGMINKAMRIHRHNVIYCRKELQSRILMSDYDPFKNDNFIVVDKKGTRNKVASDKESSIIVTTSGMLSGGPVLFYLPKLAHRPENKLLMVGYQAEGTLGREIQDGARKVEINGSQVNMQLKVETYHLSAHADRPGLELIMNKVKGLKNVFIVHGEKSKSESLREYASKRFNASVPGIKGTYTI